MNGEFVGEYSRKGPSLLTITGEHGEMLRFEPNGDIFVKGELVENAKDVVDAFRQFLTEQKLL